MKKAAIDLSSSMVMIIMDIFLIVTVSVLVVAYSSSFIKADVNLKDTEASLIMPRLFYSSSCFAYSSFRVFPGIIDMEKFKVDRLKGCLKTDNYLVRAELDYSGRTSFIVNSDDFYEEQEFCGFSKYFCKEKKQYVLVRSNGQLTGGILSIKVIKSE